jgi:hypothetical protein
LDNIWWEALFKCHNLWPIISNLFMKNWTIDDERPFKYHHLGQSLWPANQKQFVYEKFGQYMVRGYWNITTWANHYGRPIRSNHFISLALAWTIAFGAKFTGPTYFHTIWRMFFIQNSVYRPSPMSPL